MEISAGPSNNEGRNAQVLWLGRRATMRLDSHNFPLYCIAVETLSEEFK